MTLGDLIKSLQDFHPDYEVTFSRKWNIGPTSLRSFRGYYDQLALGYEIGGLISTVGYLLAELESANGKIFEGYKGGDYLMDLSTEVWAANYGESSERKIVEVRFRDEQVVLKTQLY